MLNAPKNSSKYTFQYSSLPKGWTQSKNNLKIPINQTVKNKNFYFNVDVIDDFSNTLKRAIALFILSGNIKVISYERTNGSTSLPRGSRTALPTADELNIYLNASDSKKL